MAALAATSVALCAPHQASSCARGASLRLSGLQGQKLAVVCNGSRVVMADATKAAEAPKGFTPPTLNADTPAPIFGGSTGGLLRKAQVEEFYVITWESPKEQIFEMPTGKPRSLSLSNPCLPASHQTDHNGIEFNAKSASIRPCRSLAMAMARVSFLSAMAMCPEVEF
jgi:hypothetical protein